VFKNPALLSGFNNNYEYFIPHTMKVEKKSAKSQEVALKIKEFYFGDEPVSRETLQPLFDVSNIKVYIFCHHHHHHHHHTSAVCVRNG
jgi:hypothetical protein